MANDPLKYARGTAARVPPEKRPLSALEWAVVIHVGILLIAITWAFGGGAESLRPALAWWGSLGLLLTLTATRDRDAWAEGWNRPLTWLWPFAAFNVLTLAAYLNPSFREMRIGDELMLVHREGRAAWPSSAQPALALRGLWYFDSLWIPAFNIALVIRQRRILRGLLLLAVVNALVLSIFGTAQKLGHATGPYFGTIQTPQPYFFASFIYHNHWGAFTLLMLATGLGLVWHYVRRLEDREFLRSPGIAGFVGLLLVAVTIPLSGSRSSTLLASLLAAGALAHWLVRLIRRSRRTREPIALPIAGAAVALALGLAGIWIVARDVIERRTALTRSQVADMVARGGIGSRAELYADTWRMARDKPWFGWGMQSFPHVFTLYNTQHSVDRLPVFYRDAHSDWLQSFAEHGFVGSALLALCGLVPLARMRRRHFTSTIPTYLLAGCGLILLYAWVEFPFGNLAVVLTWWICFFVAIQYARLQDREAPVPVKTIPSVPSP